MVEKNSKKLSASFEENIRYMNETLPVKENGKTFLIHSELFPIPNDFLMLTETHGNILLIFEKGSRYWGILEIYETSIKKSMYQFLVILDKSLLTESV